MKWFITFNIQYMHISTISMKSLTIHKYTQSLHKCNTTNTHDNDTFHYRQNLLMMNLVSKLTTSFINMITDIIIKTSWLDHTLCKSTVTEGGTEIHGNCRLNGSFSHLCNSSCLCICQ